VIIQSIVKFPPRCCVFCTRACPRLAHNGTHNTTSNICSYERKASHAPPRIMASSIDEGTLDKLNFCGFGVCTLGAP
jgi:hypothetical protein